jgi:hypothetical protein
MNSVAYIDGLHYYRSNSKVDVCKLTYYIKWYAYGFYKYNRYIFR